MLTIRLFRFGTKNSPTYRIAVSPKQKDTHGTYIESVGNYNPKANPKTLNINAERVKYWISVGAQPSPTVYNLLVSQGIISGDKVKAFKVTKPEVASATPEASKATPVATA